VTFALYAQPSLFSNTATLRLAVPGNASHATLRIFDAGGRLVRTLHDGAIATGIHPFEWTVWMLPVSPRRPHLLCPCHRGRCGPGQEAHPRAVGAPGAPNANA